MPNVSPHWMQKSLGLAGCAAVALMLAGTTSARAIEVAICAAPGTGGVEEAVLDRFADYLDEAMPDTFHVNKFMGGILGPEDECTEQLQDGEIQIQYAGVRQIELFLGVGTWPFNIPFLLDDRTEAQRILDEEFVDTINDGLVEHGLEIVGTAMRTPRKLSARRAITHPDDVRGLSLRLPEVSEWVVAWRDGLGANTVALPGSEVFSAMQTGLIEAQENPVSFYYTQRLFEVNDYIINTDHVLSPRVMYVSLAWLDRLDAAQREAVMAAGARAMREQFDMETEWEGPLIEELEAAGVTFVDVDRGPWRERVFEAVRTELRGNYSDEIWERFIEPRLN